MVLRLIGTSLGCNDGCARNGGSKFGVNETGVLHQSLYDDVRRPKSWVGFHYVNVVSHTFVFVFGRNKFCHLFFFQIIFSGVPEYCFGTSIR